MITVYITRVIVHKSHWCLLI